MIKAFNDYKNEVIDRVLHKEFDSKIEDFKKEYEQLTPESEDDTTFSDFLIETNPHSWEHTNGKFTFRNDTVIVRDKGKHPLYWATFPAIDEEPTPIPYIKHIKLIGKIPKEIRERELRYIKLMEEFYTRKFELMHDIFPLTYKEEIDEKYLI